MKKLLSLIILTALTLTQAVAGIKVSTTTDKPEHRYQMANGNGIYANAATGTTKTESSYGQFAFLQDAGSPNYYIYSVTAGKWLTYTAKTSYSGQKNFVQLTPTKPSAPGFKVTEYQSGKFEIQPLTTSGTASTYLNWYQGLGGNPYDTDGVTLGLWTDSGSQDNGSSWTLSEVIIIEGFTPQMPANLTDILSAHGTDTYRLAQVYPQQQTAVGPAQVEKMNADTVITLYNNVLAATFVNDRGHLFFGGSRAMNLEPGTEPFTVAIQNGTVVPASAMTLLSLDVQDLTADPHAVGGSKHFAGKQLTATYSYPTPDGTLHILWKAILRDGSHYLRTEMELTTTGNVKMYYVIPMLYDVNTQTAGSTPSVVGNTRGAVLMSHKIFAGLEHPTAYNTVGDADSSEDKYTLSSTTSTSLTKDSWTQMPAADVPARVIETTDKNYPNIYQYQRTGITLQKSQKVVVTIQYTSGSNRLNFGGVDLLESSGSVAASDYHSGYSGTASDKNTFTFTAPHDGTYTIRAITENGTEAITASSTMTIAVYTPKEGTIITDDVVRIQGRWSRNTTLQEGENWKISAVVGLIAQDANSTSSDYTVNQKRRSFLAYSERERAVPWRCNPAYISWYELNINRNNAAPGSEPTNMRASQVLDVEQQWLKNLYHKYGVGPNSFVIDDGWDTYGEWQFHSGFPNEMRDISALAARMGAGVGAWLGPVGGYGQSGNYRRNYWSTKGGMVLGNPAYYQVFKDAATNLVQNQGKKADGTHSYQFFKFDGISAQFSATGPDSGDSGNENAEGIIRLERFVREELKEDIFFNTTVGTWASPFWFHYTDAVWRQENDYGTSGNNQIDRENWITYRDRLVYQNFVQNSPICPINTLMTHGFILSNFGSVSSNKTYAACLRELRCAFACGSGMVELYNDYALMNSINDGALWKDLADLIKWQKAYADVLPDAHWVGGNPWDGTNEAIYGWGAWNGDKAVLTLRNGDDATASKSITLTLRQALNIPADIKGTVRLSKSWSDQANLQGWPQTEAIDIDQQLTLTLPKNTVYMFGTQVALQSAEAPEHIQVVQGQPTVLTLTCTPADATRTDMTWTTDDATVATVQNGVITGHALGTTTICGTSVTDPTIQVQTRVTVTENPNALTVIISGTTQGRIQYAGTTYADGDLLIPDEGYSPTDFTATPVFGLAGDISLDAERHTLTATYSNIVSTTTAPRWFFINFTHGGTYMQAHGQDLVTTATPDAENEAQQFALIGSSTSNFKILQKDGLWLSAKTATATNGQTGSLLYGTTDASQALTLCLQNSPNGNSQFVISQTTDKSKGFNTWGGSSAGLNIGFWSTSDNNDQLLLIPCPVATRIHQVDDNQTGEHVPDGKYILGGRLVIIRAGKVYTPLGQQLK